MSTGKLEGKVVIVTGGGFGFGQGIVTKFIREGAKVVLVDINEENGANVAKSQPEGSAIFVQGDVSCEADWVKARDITLSHFGRIDVVVNNAGIVNKATPSLELLEEHVDKLYQVNVKSLYFSAKIIAPVLRKQGGGCFVNISSISALRPRPKLVWYAASKGAASAATKGLASELAKDNIRCNAVCPVAGDTAMVPLVLGKPDTPENRKEIVAGIPLGRFATAIDVANAASFLASDEAAFITGIELPVDGGRALI
ncbi:oxidoreductase, short-chain dehydrogenase/reductase family [Paecilomyces variotii No. 5]|uniref:Oxidoreductase, short-chain dehydrogenase/reductase family n=1 Tax=Byssochlamys spectabilis (strain No. 5 / NBRC 109023) TaxID=1356009 RepID=V5FKU7_BYSSN|nr:oxidoreductase, short-chain dehydrogenase/reductase family [Paecilomyces variotii No. 5]